MLYDTGDIKNDVLVKLQANTSIAFFTDTILDSWVDTGHRWACSFNKWPFTEYMDKSGAFVSGTEVNSYPNAGFKSDSIRILKVGDKLFNKINFEDYLKFREEQSSNTARVFSDYGRIVYINPNCTSGTIYAYGQLTPTELDSTDPSATTKFSGADETGNEAIVEKCLEFSKLRENKLKEAVAHRDRAIQILNELWDKIGGEQHAYKPFESEGMYKRLDVLDGSYYDDKNNPNQF